MPLSADPGDKRTEEPSNGGLVVPDVVADKYKVLHRLGAGGMGEVYEVQHLQLGRHFAIKFIRNGRDRSGTAIRRMEREARAIARIECEHVVGVLDYGETAGGIPYLVMELLRGQDLRRLLTKNGPLPVLRAASIVLDACRGASAIHAAGIVHRDLKPENLFVSSRSTGEDLCKVLDFGIVKTDETTSTKPGNLIGTVRYMAPEQLTNAVSVSPATDVYALGAILFECLTGQAPFVADNVQQLMFKILNESPPSLETVAAVPKALGAVVRRAMAKAPEERFTSAEELRRALKRALEQDGADRSPTVLTGEYATVVLDVPVRTPGISLSLSVRRWATGIALASSFALGVWVSRTSGVKRDRDAMAQPAPVSTPSLALPAGPVSSKDRGLVSPSHDPGSKVAAAPSAKGAEEGPTESATEARPRTAPHAEGRKGRVSVPVERRQNLTALFDRRN